VYSASELLMYRVELFGSAEGVSGGGG
jgi:hypothetical protein